MCAHFEVEKNFFSLQGNEARLFSSAASSLVTAPTSLPLFLWQYSRTTLIRTLVIRISNYPDGFGPSCKFVENSTKLTCFEITGYRIKYNEVLLLVGP